MASVTLAERLVWSPIKQSTSAPHKKTSHEPLQQNKKVETARRISSIRAPIPPSPSSSPYKSMARELIELGKMYTDGLLSKEEFTKAKEDLVK